MALRVLCHYCRSTINIAEHLRGRAIRCPYCQQATKVPGAQPQVRRPQPPKRMARPAQPVVPALPLPDRVTRMPPPRTHFEGVDVPDHVYQEPAVEDSVQFEILQRPEAHLQDYDDSSAAASEADYDDVPMPLESRKRRSSPLFWLGIFLLVAVLAGAAAAGVVMYVKGWSFEQLLEFHFTDTVV